VIELSIGKDGLVRDARVVASAPDKERLEDAIARKGSPEATQGDARLAAAALDAVRGWSYEPVLKDGRPVDFKATVTVNFRLS
jgi:outer membrane biosynthesis protein TonB